MGVLYLDHVNIKTSQLSVMLAFYTEVIGLRVGARPDFSFGGAWLYAGERACVHLVALESGSPERVTAGLEHYSFVGEGQQDFLARLERAGVSYRLRNLTAPQPDGSWVELIQVDLRDPDGNRLHVDFRAT